MSRSVLVQLMVMALAAAIGGSSPVPAPKMVTYFDLTYTASLDHRDRFEHTHTTACISALANRASPTMFTRYVAAGANVDDGSSADDDWKAFLTQPGEWLASTQWENVTSIEGLLLAATKSGAPIHGAVLFDENVPATSALASTACGVEGLIPVCNRPGVDGSMYERLIANGPKLSVVLNLTGQFKPSANSTAKIDAYNWAIDRWLMPKATNPANPAKLAYYVDYWGALQGDRLNAPPGMTQASNHDYFMAHKAFFFDLSVWDDEAPVDDPNQPLGLDRQLLIRTFSAAYNRTQADGYDGPQMLHVGGFTPWWFKYANNGPGCPKCKHGGVETEWETMGTIGAYNAFDDGDACCVGAMANAAFYQHYPLPSTLAQNPKPTIDDLKARGFIDSNGIVKPAPYAAYYGGDYDGSAWLYSQMKQNWDDPRRGDVPIGWAIDSELSMRFPVIFPYLYATKTKNDYFISGDSGAGYLNPTLLIPDPKTGRRGQSEVTKAGTEAWKEWNTAWYKQFDLSFTGFLINGNQGVLTNESLAIYDSFSADGVVVTTGHDPTPASKHNGAAWVTSGGTPVIHHVVDLDRSSVNNSAHQIQTIVNGDSRDEPTFYFLRNILCTAGFMVDVANNASALVPELVWVDPYTMGLLVKSANKLVAT